MRTPLERWSLGISIAGVAVAMLVVGWCDQAHGTEASTQAARPWTLGQCDRLRGRPAVAVFNASTHSHNGWPLWRVICYYGREK